MRLGKLLRRMSRGFQAGPRPVTLSKDMKDIVHVPLDGPGVVRGVTVVGQPGKDCRIGFAPGVASLDNVEVRFVGDETHDRVTVVLGAFQRGRVLIHIHGSDARVQIGTSKLMNADCVVGPNAEVMIGNHTTAGNMTLAAKHGCITIGEDCMISGKVQFNAAMDHAVVDLSGEEPRLENDPRHLRVGDHVWVGNSTALLGNCNVGSGSIIGWGAVVAGDIPANVVAVGNPAQVVRSNATWTRIPENFDPMTRDYLESHFEAVAASSNPTGLNQAGQALSEGSHP